MMSASHVSHVALHMLDIDAQVDKMLAHMPTPPGVPDSICDAKFLPANYPADYVIRTDPSESSDVCPAACPTHLFHSST